MGSVLPVLAQPALFSQSLLAQAGSVEELQRQQEQIERRRSRIANERDRLKRMEQSAQGNLKNLKRNITITSSQIDSTEKKLQKSTQRLQDLEVALVKAEQSYHQRQYATVARLRFLQRQQVDRGWAVLLQSENLNQFLDRRRQLKLVYQSDREMLDRLKQEAVKLDHQRDQVEQQKNEIALLKQELLAQKADFELQADSEQQLISRLTTDRRALEAAENQLAQDSQNVAALIRQRLSTGSRAMGTGRFVYPSSGPITSSFGWRLHPVLGYQRFHAGVDFGADYGTVIFAADSGTVIFAGWYGGYGNAVIIDHGNGLTTLYGHCSEIYVSEGQAVQRGQAIAAVGSTGLSTGPHLHFEVRKNGEPTDPMAYL